MIRQALKATAFLCAIFAGSSAYAGVYTDDFTKCLVKSTSDADKLTLVKWIFADITLNPALAPMSNVTDGQRDDLNRQVAALIQKLVLADCRQEARDAVKYEGAGVFEPAFEVLGGVATRSMLTDPATQAGSAAFGKYLDKQQWDQFDKEAGQPASPAAK